MRFLKHIFVAVSLLLPMGLQAWIYPEHRDIGILAIQKLSPEKRALLDRLWSEARTGYEGRLTEAVIDPKQGRKPTQLDYASWMGIAGDHSCSPKDMLNTVLHSDWILNVADVAAHLKVDLHKANKMDQYVNAIRNSDIRLQRADIEYATRAGSNNVHFLLARTDVNESMSKYFSNSLSKGVEINATGSYAWFHSLALQKAAQYAREGGTKEEKNALILAALADEAFALHFLEDIFAAGHVAGTWGKASIRKGTHDHYNEKGLEVVTWDGKRVVLLGDAFMSQPDAEITATALVISLEQLLAAASGEMAQSLNKTVPALPDTLDVCKNNLMPAAEFDSTLLRPVLITIPVAGLASGPGSVPRFRSELGLFFGASVSLGGATINGGFGPDQNKVGAVGALEANLRFGVGLDGVINQSGDGLVFLQLGWRQDAASSTQFLNEDSSFPASTITSYIPGRSAYNVRFRMPFWLIPGDLIIAAPILGIASPKTFQRMAVAAANGGAIPWQSGIATPIGRFQFMLGREIGVSFYGLGETADAVLIPTSTTTASLITLRTTKFDFPFLEYRPFTTFSQDQSSSLLIQFSVGVDVPHHEKVIQSSAVIVPELKSVGYIGTRIIFNWRRYF